MQKSFIILRVGLGLFLNVFIFLSMSSAQEKVEYVSYVNNEYKFRVNIPRDWGIVDAGDLEERAVLPFGKPICAFVDTEDEFVVNVVTIGVQTYDNPVDFRKYFEYLKEKMADDKYIVNKPEIIYLDTQPAVRYVMVVPSQRKKKEQEVEPFNKPGFSRLNNEQLLPYDPEENIPAPSKVVTDTVVCYMFFKVDKIFFMTLSSPSVNYQEIKPLFKNMLVSLDFETPVKR